MPSPLAVVFAEIPDPRRETENKLHRLVDVLTIATCAVLGGADSWEAIAEDGRTKEPSFRPALTLPNGVPSPNTFARIFAKIDPPAFAKAFGRWMTAACEATGLVRSPSTASRTARPGATPPPAACTWSRPGPPRTG